MISHNLHERLLIDQYFENLFENLIAAAAKAAL